MADLTLLLFGGGSVGLMAGAAALRDRLAGRQRLPYRRRDGLLTAAERAFYGALCRAVEADWQVFAQVRVADLLTVPKETRNRQSFVSRITSKHVDFVLCDRQTLSPVAALELDDSSHQLANRRQRDIFLDAAFEAAGLPLLRVPVRGSYDAAELHDLIHGHLAVAPQRPRRRLPR